MESTGEETQQAGKNKRLWSYIKNQKTSSAGISPLKVNTCLHFEPRAKAEVLNNHFKSVFSNGASYTPEEFEAKCTMKPEDYPSLDTISITKEGVRMLLHNLDPKKAYGPDNITARVLSVSSNEIAPILTIIYKASLDSGNVPTDWKRALVTPIFKKGEHYDPGNYRPVSLTCISCKVLEHCIVSSTMNHLETNNILSPQQHGFRRQRSCETQLLKLIDELMEYMESGKQTDLLIMDFAKAFDRVNHSLLLHKLYHYGVQGSVH